MEKSNAIQILNSRKLIAEPGKYQLKVTSSTLYTREDGTVVRITNFAAMTAYQLGEAKRLFGEEQYQEATNQSLASSQRVGKDYTPAKGEIVNVVVDYIKNKEDINILAVVSVSPLPTAAATNVSFSEVEEAEPAAQEETPLV